jgi:hypothetical protein
MTPPHPHSTRAGQEGKAGAAPGANDEEDEDDDDYDLFGSDEDDRAASDARLASAGQSGPPKTDVQIYGTLKRLAVDENFVHADQSMDLPVRSDLSAPDKAPRSVFLLAGARGNGKSACLYHAVHYARKSGWVVLLIPSAHEYLHGGGYIKPSPHFRGYFDQPDLSQATLNQLLLAHGHQLSQLHIQVGFLGSGSCASGWNVALGC